MKAKWKQFERFTQTDINAFLRAIVLGYSRGESIRGICLKYVKGDRTRLLRYQNKYRNIAAKKPDLINKTAASLEKEGYFVKNPVKVTPPQNNIIEFPPQSDYNNLTDQDIQNLFMGLIRLVRKQNQSQIEKLRAEIARLTRQTPHSKPSEH